MSKTALYRGNALPVVDFLVRAFTYKELAEKARMLPVYPGSDKDHDLLMEGLCAVAKKRLAEITSGLAEKEVKRQLTIERDVLHDFIAAYTDARNDIGISEDTRRYQQILAAQALPR